METGMRLSSDLKVRKLCHKMLKVGGDLILLVGRNPTQACSLQSVETHNHRRKRNIQFLIEALHVMEAIRTGEIGALTCYAVGNTP